MLFLDLKTSTTAAVSLAILAGAASAASIPYSAAAEIVAWITCTFASIVAGMYLSFFRSVMAFSNLMSKVLLEQLFPAERWAPR